MNQIISPSLISHQKQQQKKIVCFFFLCQSYIQHFSKFEKTKNCKTTCAIYKKENIKYIHTQSWCAAWKTKEIIPNCGCDFSLYKNRIPIVIIECQKRGKNALDALVILMLTHYNFHYDQINITVNFCEKKTLVLFI